MQSTRSVVAFAALLLLAPLPALSQQVKIVHINVGQGDATLILGPRDPSGDRVSILFDSGDITSGGDPDGGALVTEVLQGHSLQEIDFVIVSHYDSDHIGGIIAGASHIHGSSFLLGRDGAPGSPGDDDGDGQADWLDESMINPDPEELGTGDDVRVGAFVDRGNIAPASDTTAAYKKYIGMATAVGSRVSLVDRDDVEAFEIDLGGGARMRALAANGFVRDRPSRVANVNTENERSLAFLLEFGRFDYLIGGDLIGRQAGGENAHVEEAVGECLDNNGVEVDVLHVNHHGADNASESTFLGDIEAEVAIISLGNDNGHGHPVRAALERLEAAGVEAIFQTGWGETASTPNEVRRIQAILQGDVVLVSDGESFEVSLFRRFEVDEP